MLSEKTRYAIKFSKGPEVRLKPHPEHCELSDLKDYGKSLEAPLAIDLFCGAGGLSLGLTMAGYSVILGVDRNKNAVETHSAYFGGASIQRDLSMPDVAEEICVALDGLSIDLIAGGPPCQPFSQAAFSKVRHLRQNHGRGDDLRRDLWQSYMRIVDSVRPAAVLIENVPEMGYGRDGYVLRELIERLEGMEYKVSSKILNAWPFGVPQYRNRLIIVAVKGDHVFFWPQGSAKPERLLREAISDLPVVTGGDKTQRRPYPGKTDQSQAYYRDNVVTKDDPYIYDHFTREVRLDDLKAFELMTSSTKYHELPEGVKRYRQDIFVDKYKRLSYDELSRTITAHIAKDGYWYIHPEQHRTLTVREAARIQTFPDWFRFAGFPANAFHQIGEAVPPLLGRALGEAILKSAETPSCGNSPTTHTLADVLEAWLKKQYETDCSGPWRAINDTWKTLIGEILLGRLSSSARSEFWPRVRDRWSTPEDYLSDSSRDELLCLIKGNRDLMDALARSFRASCTEERILSEATGNGVTPGKLIGALAVCGISTRRPSRASLLRLAERVWSETKSHIDGRGADELKLSRLIGPDPHGMVYSAALEVSEMFCKTRIPHCKKCPLQDHCMTAIGELQIPSVVHGLSKSCSAAERPSSEKSL